jgi:putative FmdB family regulatory protein
MPTYQYKCLACGHDFEMFQKMNDETIKECPKCAGKVKRLLGTGAGTIFKGSGFYHTDYKNAKQESKTSNPKSSDSKDKAKDS